MMFSAMWAVQHDVFCHVDTWMLFRTVILVFTVRYRFDGNLFNLRRLQAKTKVLTDVLDELLYANDMDKNLG